MILAAVLFVILVAAYFMYADKMKKINETKAEELKKAYSDKNLAKMEYDVAVYDEETRKLLTHEKSESQVTMDEIVPDEKERASDAVLSSEDALFGKVDDEGMEEITGTYKGDDDWFGNATLRFAL